MPKAVASTKLVVGRSWATKHRPRRWRDVVGQEDSLQTLQGMLARASIPGAVLFHGPSGCGKTTLARLFGRYINCETNDACGKCASCMQNPDRHVDVTELNAAEKRGIDDVRGLISTAKFVPKNNMRIFIVDEAHQLTPHALETLLKEIEEPSPSTLWMICTTEPDKFKDTFLMRCAKIMVGFPAAEDMARRLRIIAKREDMKFDPAVIEACVATSQGHVREAISLLEQAANVQAMEGDVSRVIRAIGAGFDADTTDVATRLMLGVLGDDNETLVKAAFDITDTLQTLNACMYFNQYLLGITVGYNGRNLWHSPANKEFARAVKAKLGKKLTLASIIRTQRRITTLRGILHTVAGSEIGLVITHLTGDTA